MANKIQETIYWIKLVLVLPCRIQLTHCQEILENHKGGDDERFDSLNCFIRSIQLFYHNSHLITTSLFSQYF